TGSRDSSATSMGVPCGAGSMDWLLSTMILPEGQAGEGPSESGYLGNPSMHTHRRAGPLGSENGVHRSASSGAVGLERRLTPARLIRNDPATAPQPRRRPAGQPRPP